MAISFRTAQIEEAQAVAALINGAYRGESSRAGWTTEANVLDGLRTTVLEIESFIQSNQAILLLCFENEDLIGCILAEKKAQKVRFGMFVVKPTLQNRGIGKQLLEKAEQLVKETWQITHFEMIVISCRKELLEYYKRRGYFYRGKDLPFPLNPSVWTPKVSDLSLNVIEKTLHECTNSPIN
ncbi:MAG: hypothetical protein RIT27_1557 [Pseudomonadota bacterium]|jgi:GNAT superfamily N-acetyltransferase